ncbi:MAG: hypothetical protein EOM67_08560 [Spirochaetia bacterium]|nr:hypothetical protein [Spirochaetia bacterium]
MKSSKSLCLQVEVVFDNEFCNITNLGCKHFDRYGRTEQNCTVFNQSCKRVYVDGEEKYYRCSKCSDTFQEELPIDDDYADISTPVERNAEGKIVVRKEP